MGTRTDIEQVSTKTGGQQDFMNRILSQLSPELMQSLMGGNEDAFRERFQRTTADPMQQQFREQVIPELQERFAGAGSRGGDAEALQLATAGQRLTGDLGRLFEESYGNDISGQRQLMSSLSGQALGTDMFQNIAKQTTTADPFADLLGGFGKGIGSAIGSGGNPFSMFSGMFGNQ